MPRGGSRTGSGRPRTLSDLERLEVGAECEVRWKAMCIAKGNEAVEAVSNGREIAEATTEYKEAMKRLNEIPVPDREDWLRSYEADDHRDIVESYLKQKQGIAYEDDTAPSRLSTVKVARPYGVQKQIIAQVAEEYSAKLGRPVLPSTVRHCWDEMRARL